jgi:hypothetical protein
MCKKLFAVVLVLGLVSSAFATLGDDGRLLLWYTMDAADSGSMMPGHMTNRGNLLGGGPPSFGVENFLSSDGIDYSAGLIGEALHISNDGTGEEPYIPAGGGWGNDTRENGDYIDIQPAAEDGLFAESPDGLGISMWINETAPLNLFNHVGLWQGQIAACAMPFGTHWKYYGMIKVHQNSDKPGVDSDYLSVKVGGTGNSGTGPATAYFDTGNWTEGVTIGNEPDYREQAVELALDTWYHVVLTMGATDPVTGMCMADVYVNGSLLWSEEVVGLPAARGGGLTTWPGLAVGAYHEVSKEHYFVQIPDGMLIDDFAIVSGGLSAAEVASIYELGLQGIDVSNAVPEPATIALLGLGGLALLRRKR